MANPHGSFIWYELMTADPDGAKRFYDSVVGWNIEHQAAGEMDYRMIRRRDGGHAGGVLRLTEEMIGGGARPVWLGYIGVDDVDALVSEAVRDGARVVMPAVDLPGVGRFALLADLDGAPFYVMRGASGESSDVYSVDAPQHVRWNELSASEPGRAMSFYTRHFGWVEDGAMPMGELGSYRFLKHGETVIGALMPLMPGRAAASWTFYIGVDDIDRAAAAVTSGGGEITQPPQQIPGGEYAMNAVDPQGAAFALVGPRKGEPS